MIRKALKNRYIVALLAVAAIFAVGMQLRQLLPVKSNRLSKPPPAEAAVPQKQAPAGSGEPAISISENDWDLELKRNPFQPAKALLPASGQIVAEEEQQSLELQAIWIQGASRWAVLNQRVVGEGEALLEWKVREIKPDRVVVEGARGEKSVLFKTGAE